MDKNRTQNQTIQRLCTDRKHDNFQLLKQWDMQRARKLMIHRKIIDQLDDSIQIKLSQSSAYIDVVRQFLTDLLTQKIKYELQTVNNPETKIKNNLAGKSMHIWSGHQLGRLYHLTSDYKGYKKLKSILEKGLQKVQNLLIESQKQIMEMKTTIELTINEIQNNNESASEICTHIVSIYNKEKHLKSFQCEKDLYIEEQRFLYQAFLQTEIQRTLGKVIVQYLEYVEDLEKKKLVLIKEVIGSYLEGVKEDHEDEAQLNLLQDILKKDTENKYIEECYSSDQLFSKEVKEELSKIHEMHTKEMSLKFVKQFLKKLEYEYFGFINFLVMKEYHIFVKIEEQLIEIILIVTVDGFLNFYFTSKAIELNQNSQETLIPQIDYSAKIDESLITERDGDIALEVQSKKSEQSFLLPASSPTVNLVFMNEDQREEFLQVVERLTR